MSTYINNLNEPNRLKSILIKEFWDFTRTLDNTRGQDFLTVYPEFEGKI